MKEGLPQWRRKLIAAKLRQEAVIAYPTEGVWGLGCIPQSAPAVARILELKRRSWEAGLILVGSNIKQLEPYLRSITPGEREILLHAWPGPVTFLVPDCGAAPEWIRGKHTTVALRLSDHPVICSICDQLGEAIVSTSANPTGHKPARDVLRLRQYFPGGIDYIVPGELGGQPGASEIRVLRGGDVVRPATGKLR